MAGLKTPTKPTTAKTTHAADKATNLKDDPAREREVLFPELTVCGIEIPEENLYVNAEECKTLLGWESESDHEARLTEGVSPEQASKMNVKFGDQYDFKDYNGEKVRLLNNVRNRPLDEAWLKQLAADIINLYWRFNGEAWIIGQTGLALSVQHRAHAVIRAQQILDYAGDDEEKKEAAARAKKAFPDGVVRVKAVVVRGIEEGPDVTRTLDNVRPRSLSDVLFADTSNFAKTSKDKREKLCKLTDYAIRTVQGRTGEDDDAFAPRRSHSAPLEFLGRHPRIIKAVNHIFTETERKDSNAEKVSVLEKYISGGTAAGLMFLMGCSESDRERWDNANPSPNDRHLNFDNWDKAEEFFAGLGDATNKNFGGIREAISQLGNKATGTPAPAAVKAAVVVNGWNEFIQGGTMSKGNVMPEFGDMNDNGVRPLAMVPAATGADGESGIDLGSPKAVRKAEEEEEARLAAEAEAEAQAAAALEVEAAAQAGPSKKEQEEIEKRKQEVKKAGLDAKKNETPKGKLKGGTGR